MNRNRNRNRNNDESTVDLVFSIFQEILSKTRENTKTIVLYVTTMGNFSIQISTFHSSKNSVMILLESEESILCKLNSLLGEVDSQTDQVGSKNIMILLFHSIIIK